MKLSSVFTKFHFITALFLAISALSACGISAELEDYWAAERINTVEAYEEFISKYPNGDFRDNAEDDIQGLHEAARSQPLLKAAYSGELAQVRSLLDNGVSPNFAGEFEGADNLKHLEWTALMYAAEKGHEEIVQTLLVAGASVNHSSIADYTALMAAAEFGHKDIVQTLLSAGAEIDHRQLFSDSTALMLASKNGHEEIAQALLAAGADETTVRWWGFSVGDSAQPVKVTKGMTPQQVSDVLGFTIGATSETRLLAVQCPITIVHPFAAFSFDQDCRLWIIVRGNRSYYEHFYEDRVLRANTQGSGTKLLGEH